MAGGTTRKSTRAASSATGLQESNGDAAPQSLSPTAEALQALKNLSSPAKTSRTNTSTNGTTSPTTVAPPEIHVDDDATIDADRLRIQAPAPTSSALSLSSSMFSGLTSISPASGLSAPTSPADDGLDTPDGDGDSGSSSKRQRLLDCSAPPLFLEKTYEMLDKCAPAVACWSASGDSFVVKNPVAFAEHVIPVYFKHKNFSSFVRQLNFYGFRKVRVVDPETTGGVNPKDWWEFRHEKFLRGRKELLREIKRRSLPSAGNNPSINGVQSSGQMSGKADGARSSIDRGEIDDLRNEVCTLREQIQTLNKHMFSVMQIMMTRATPSAPLPPQPGAAAPPPVAYPPPHYAQPQYHPYFAGLPPPHPVTPAMNGGVPNKNDKRHVGGGGASPSAHSAGYALRPIQTFVAAGVPPGYPYPLTPSGDPSMDWEVYSRHAYHAAAQLGHPHTPSGSGAGSAPGPLPNARPPSSSVPAVPGLKRSRSQQKRSPSAGAPAATPTTPTVSTAPVNHVDNPVAAVRHLSQLVTQIRTDLLQGILGRTLSFIRVQPPASENALQNPEIEAIAEAVVGDIQQGLAQINEAEAATHGRPRGSVPSETSHMYRVEMLKFVSKELPRAMSEAVEKRLPAATKKTLNRSLLALMVQKAQAALEAQMRHETAHASNSA